MPILVKFVIGVGNGVFIRVCRRFKLEAQKAEPVSLTWYELGLITQMLQANQIQEFPMATIFV